MSAASDGPRVAALCMTKPHTTDELIKATGWGESRVREAIDWCRANRLINLNPFLVWNAGGGRWEYGFRARLTEVAENVYWNLGYCQTRIGNARRTYEHALQTTASLKNDPLFGRAVRRDFKNSAILLNGVEASLDMAKIGLNKILVP